MHTIPMTPYGANQLRTELDTLTKEARPKVIQAIATAREFGDLKENAEYHAAKEQQGLIEARIKDIKHRLSHAQIIDVTTMENEGRVIFGATVDLLHTDTDTTKRYQIVGEDEANIKDQKISVTSPIARGLIGKHEGDEAIIQTPDGEVVYEIEQVAYI